MYQVPTTNDQGPKGIRTLKPLPMCQHHYDFSLNAPPATIILRGRYHYVDSADLLHDSDRAISASSFDDGAEHELHVHVSHREKVMSASLGESRPTARGKEQAHRNNFHLSCLTASMSAIIEATTSLSSRACITAAQDEHLH